MTTNIILDRDEDRTVSSGLLEALERASRYSEPILLDCSAAADIYGEIIRLRAALEKIANCEKVCDDGRVVHINE